MRRPFLLKQRGKIWYYRLAGHATFHSTGQTSKTAAMNYAQEALARNEPPPRPRLQDYTADFYRWDTCEWIRRQHAKGRRFSRQVADACRSQLERYILPEFGGRRLDEINAVEVENWLVGLDRANQTKNHLLYTLNIILKEAKRQKVITVNPLDDVEPMAKQYRPRDVFTPAELRALFPGDPEAMVEVWREPRYAALFFVLATTGLRSGEARALQWRCIAWERQGIYVVQEMKTDTEMGTTKSGDERAVLVPTQTMEMLAWWHKQTMYGEPDDFVFPGMDRTRPVTSRTAGGRLHRALAHVGIDRSVRNLVVGANAKSGSKSLTLGQKKGLPTP